MSESNPLPVETRREALLEKLVRQLLNESGGATLSGDDAGYVAIRQNLLDEIEALLAAPLPAPSPDPVVAEVVEEMRKAADYHERSASIESNPNIVGFRAAAMLALRHWADRLSSRPAQESKP